MFSEKAKRHSHHRKSPRKSRVTEVTNTLEWLITAFILAFVFRAFVMEAFRIPTGSMADTLMGVHLRLRCLQCGYRYNFGFDSSSYYLSRNGRQSPQTHCPSCGFERSVEPGTAVSKGDRILVLKCIYQFFEPKQWDVVVFKNPPNPTINYIKRLVGRPGETVEIIDGDVYIDNQISRKPPKVQNQLWIPIYDNDYQPARPLEGSFNGHIWQQPFDVANSKWSVHPDSPTKFTLDTKTDQVSWLSYDSDIGNSFRAANAYNSVMGFRNMPYCSDLMVRFYARASQSRATIGVALSKYATHYKGWVDGSGEMVISKVTDASETILAREPIENFVADKAQLLKFSNVDHMLIFEFGDEKLTYDLGRSSDAAGPRKRHNPPQVKIFGSGSLELSHVAIFRDIHYTGARHASLAESGRAIEGNPLKLEKDQFFVLGDNSPNSEDGRWWTDLGKGNNGTSYPAGIVPRDYLVGKAMFVYWPSGFKPFPKSRFAIVPNFGKLRFIYGGS